MPEEPSVVKWPGNPVDQSADAELANPLRKLLEELNVLELRSDSRPALDPGTLHGACR